MSELPKGWAEISCGDTFTQISTSKIKVKSKDTKEAGEFPVIDQGANFIAGYIDDEQCVIKVEKPVCVFGDHTRVVKWVDFNFVPGADGTKVLVPDDYLYGKFFFYQLKNAEIKDRGYSRHFKYLKETMFRIAPFNEQIRIADKLDSMLAKVDAAQARLDKIPVILKRFRQSVLAAATSGELTREWREDDGHQWRTVQLKDVGKGFNYGSSAKSKPEGDVPVLRMGNLQGGKLDWSNLVFTSDEAEIEKYLLETGDILFNRTNSPELVGKTSIYRGEQKAIYAGYLIRVKGSEQLNTEFLNIQLNSPHARDYCWQVKTDGVSQSNINAKKLQAYEFDLPPMSEQLEIVRRVNELFSRADLFERQYLDARKAFSRLTQSILAKAFRGELVEQEDNDEPASELLARILIKKEDKSLAKTKKESVSKVVNTKSNDDRSAKNIDQASVIKWIGDLKEDTFSNEDLNESFRSDYEQLKEILFSLLKEDKPMITKVFDVDKKDFIFKKVKG